MLSKERVYEIHLLGLVVSMTIFLEKTEDAYVNRFVTRRKCYSHYTTTGTFHIHGNISRNSEDFRFVKKIGTEDHILLTLKRLQTFGWHCTFVCKLLIYKLDLSMRKKNLSSKALGLE